MSFRRSFWAGAVGFCLVSVFLNKAARAAIMTYSGFDVGASASSPHPNSDAAAASFDSVLGALGTPTKVTFESAALGAFANLAIAPGATLSGVDGNGQNQTVRNVPLTPAPLYGYNITPGGSKFVGINGGTLVFTFSPGVSAFGLYLPGLQDFNTHNVSFNDGAPQQIAIPTPGSAGGAVFFGFTDAGKSIPSVTINVPGDYVSADDVRFVLTPEPSAMTLMGGAVLLATATRRRCSDNPRT